MDNEEFEAGTPEVKTLVFNPGGFILKLIASIAFAVFVGKTARESADHGVLYVVFAHALYFVMMWFLASLFGFCLRTTGNYIIAAILTVVLLVLLGFGSAWLSEKNPTLGTIAGIVFLLALVWLPINDVRKAIIYIKNTV